MLSDIEKANMALGHLGITKTIASFTENSTEARVCSQWFSVTNELLLRNFKWPFATKFVELSLVEEDPTDEWAFSYRYPTDCFYFRRILTGIPVGFLDNIGMYPGWSLINSFYTDGRVNYKIGGDDEGKLIYCSLDEAQAEYTINPDNALMTIDYDIALSYRMAAFMAKQLGKSKEDSQEMMIQFNDHMLQSGNTAANEQQDVMTDDSGFTRVRE